MYRSDPYHVRRHTVGSRVRVAEPGDDRRGRSACSDLTWREILRVERAEVPDPTPDGWWPCPFCGLGYRIHETWLVDYTVAPTYQTARAYVCASCAGIARSALRDQPELG